MLMCSWKWFLLQFSVIIITFAMVVRATQNTQMPVRKTAMLTGGISQNGINNGITLSPGHATFARQQSVSYGRQTRVSYRRQASVSYARQHSVAMKEESKAPTPWCKKFLDKRETRPHSAPFIVSIQLMTADEGLVHYCAGTIIDEHWILTAAHCINSIQMVDNSVLVAGAHDIHDSGEGNEVQMRNIDYFVRHELFLGGVNPYDVALLYTREPFQFNEFVQPAQLPEQDAIAEGYGTLYGWGNVSMTAVPSFPHKLQEANMPILDMTLCEQILAADGFTLHTTNLCTGPLSGGVSICTADSGGPLLQMDEDSYESTFTVIGIVSWGKMPCGQKNAPSVFVRVSAFTNWIRQIISTATHIE